MRNLYSLNPDDACFFKFFHNHPTIALWKKTSHFHMVKNFSVIFYSAKNPAGKNF